MLARTPVPGAVKTRLARALGDEAAAALYRAATEDLCAALATRFDLAIAASPSPDEPYFVRLARRYGVALMAQGDGDLGARMRRLGDAALARAREVVLIGSDLPTLPPRRVAQAFLELRRARVVLGPSLDGGYYLLGLRRPLPAIFDRMPWSTDRVLGRTLARLRRQGVAHALLPCWYDVDEPGDVVLLRRHLAVLAARGEDPCPRTRRVLARLGRHARPRPRRGS